MSKKQHFHEVADHFVDSHNGVYSAQVFVERVKFEQLKGITKKDYDILLAGPEHKDYVEVWANKLSNIVVTDEKGKEWSVYENEGIYLYPKDANIDWEEVE